MNDYVITAAERKNKDYKIGSRAIICIQIHTDYRQGQPNERHHSASPTDRECGYFVHFPT